MRRPRDRWSRWLVGALAVLVATGVFAAIQKMVGGAGTGAQPLLAIEETSNGGGGGTSRAPANPATRPVLGTTVTPATRPATVIASTPSTSTTPVTPPVAVTPATRPVEVTVVRPPVVVTPPPATTRPALAEAQARYDAGELVAARSLLNEALAAGRLSVADVPAARSLLQKINDQVVFSPKVFRDDPFVGTHTVRPGEHLRTIAAANGVTWELLCRINRIGDPRRMKANQSLKVVKGPFHAVVSKSRFEIDLYLGSPGQAGSVFVMSLPVGLGKDDSTPVGTWKVVNKLKNPTYHSPRGEGIIAADDPANPLGEYWLGLQGIDAVSADKLSYGIHGTIEPDSIGKSESMGCIRLRNEDVALVYELLVEGKSVVVVKE